MAGSPMKRERRELLDANEEQIIEMLGNGDTLVMIAQQFGVGRSTLMRWIAEDSRADVCAQARARAADAIADTARSETADLIGRAQLGLADQVEVAAVKLGVDVNRWVAGIWNREKYGEQKGAQVVVNIAGLHLDALRQPIAAVAPANQAAEALRRPGAPDVIDVIAHEPQPMRLEDLL